LYKVETLKRVPKSKNHGQPNMHQEFLINDQTTLLE